MEEWVEVEAKVEKPLVLKKPSVVGSIHRLYTKGIITKDEARAMLKKLGLL